MLEIERIQIKKRKKNRIRLKNKKRIKNSKKINARKGRIKIEKLERGKLENLKIKET